MSTENEVLEDEDQLAKEEVFKNVSLVENKLSEFIFYNITEEGDNSDFGNIIVLVYALITLSAKLIAGIDDEDSDVDNSAIKENLKRSCIDIIENN